MEEVKCLMENRMRSYIFYLSSCILHYDLTMQTHLNPSHASGFW
jgi:hypothetical protein